MGGTRQLLRYDATTKKFEEVSEDQLEIDSFLRVECGMPPPMRNTGFFVLEVNEMPSCAARRPAAANEAYVDQPRVKALKDELEMTKKFEATQDRLFKVAQRLHDLQAAGGEAQGSRSRSGRGPGRAERAPGLPRRSRS